jgi:hypothetical protein
MQPVRRRRVSGPGWARRSGGPDITFEPDRIFVRDGNAMASAGVTAGINLTLALVKRDYGAQIARTVARWWSCFSTAGGGQCNSPSGWASGIDGLVEFGGSSNGSSPGPVQTIDLPNSPCELRSQSAAVARVSQGNPNHTRTFRRASAGGGRPESPGEHGRAAWRHRPTVWPSAVSRPWPRIQADDRRRIRGASSALPVHRGSRLTECRDRVLFT